MDLYVNRVMLAILKARTKKQENILSVSLIWADAQKKPVTTMGTASRIPTKPKTAKISFASVRANTMGNSVKNA